ncbi:MAG: hypothetical protein K9H26_10150 [Prolixibacteraceae bacterium]|nr:hypothetical protein [Prolixibacteraceae bacterium]
MKSIILKTSIFLLFLTLLGTACVEYADEDIAIQQDPGISVYKTNKDYFDKITLGLTDEGKLIFSPGYTLTDSRITVDDDGNVSVNTRWRLKSGYIVDKESYINRVFTDITFREYVEWNAQNGEPCWPDSLLLPRITDKDPFTEFYYYDGLNKPDQNFTLGKINDMIEDGTIETVFTKLKKLTLNL